jgi:hypothetical protein
MAFPILEVLDFAGFNGETEIACRSGIGTPVNLGFLYIKAWGFAKSTKNLTSCYVYLRNIHRCAGNCEADSAVQVSPDDLSQAALCHILR